MGRLSKILFGLVGAFIALFVVAAIALVFFFDPNDFREEISTTVKEQTGRELNIDGEISLEIFPWLAVEVNDVSLGNAAGFGSEPMASFDRASFSVQILPVILRQEVVVGTADIEALRLNLAVNSQGMSNWADLASAEAEDSAADSEAAGQPPAGGIDISKIEIIDAVIRYNDAQTGDAIALDGVNLDIGPLRDDGSPVPVAAELKLDVQPAGISGSTLFETTLAFDSASGMLQLANLQLDGTFEGIASAPVRLWFTTDGVEVSTNESRVSMQPLNLNVLDIQINADVQPFSYANEVLPRATISVAAFSPRTVMQSLDIEAPVTADPMALSSVILDATVQFTQSAIALSEVEIKLDDTTFTGSLSAPMATDGAYEFDLNGDSIDLARYMAPAEEAPDEGEVSTAPIEIPVDLIRPLNANGKFNLKKATLGNIVFRNIKVGLNAGDGKMRIHPISSKLFGGKYKGDVTINATRKQPSLKLDEKIEDVDLAKLSKAMFGVENVTGSINGAFVLSGRGRNLAAIQKRLKGKMTLELKDGSYQGTDIWYELRRARAMFKQETPPEPTLPAKTDFSTISMTGKVKDGVMSSDDLFAELPFMQLTGGGTVDIPRGTIDYGVSVRVLDSPELRSSATADELDTFTAAVIPLTITGPMTSPSIRPDLEKLLKDRVEQEVKEKIEDELKDKLKDLFN